MTYVGGGVSQKKTDDTDSSFSRGVKIYVEKIMIKNIDLFINLFNLGHFMYFKVTKSI